MWFTAVLHVGSVETVIAGVHVFPRFSQNLG